MSMSPKDQQLFQTAMETIKSQQAQLMDLTAPAYLVGTVVAVYEKSAVVEMLNGATIECERPNGTDKSWVGSTVMIHPKTNQIIKRSAYVRYGQTAVVSQIDGTFVFLSVTSQNTTVTTEFSLVPLKSLNIGDYVLLNSTNSVIMKKVEFKTKYAFASQSTLDWSDIGGCAEAKSELRKALELPYVNSAVFDFFHKKRVKGGVLWGRPGMGKTLLGRACAGAIARVHKAESVSTGFIYVKGPEVLSKWVGDTEEAIRGLFNHARLHYKRYGYPAIIFVDEADALLTRRGTRTAAGMEQTVVPQFCSEMDGMEESGAFVLLATNRLDILDPAITRPGRIDRWFRVEPPTLETAPEIFGIHMRDVPIASQCDKQQLIDVANKALFSQSYPLYKLETSKGSRIFTLGDLASGALIAGLVERAASCAIDRNMARCVGVTDPKDYPPMEGLKVEDFTAALAAVHREQFGINHYDELKEYVDTEKLEVTNLAACHTAAEINTPIPKQPDSSVMAVAVPSGFIQAVTGNKDPKGGLN